MFEQVKHLLALKFKKLKLMFYYSYTINSIFITEQEVNSYAIFLKFSQT